MLFVEQTMLTEGKSDKPLSFVSFIEQENNITKDIIEAKELLILAIGILLCFFTILISVVSIQTIVKLKITLALNNINYQKALGANLISLFEKYSIGIIKPCLLGIFAGVSFTLYSAQSNIIYTNLFSSITLFYLILIVTTIVFILLITVLMSVFNGIKAQCLRSVKF
jgi:cell division protein FtsX